MKNEDIRTAEICLPYSKQGDDLAYCIERSDTLVEALNANINFLVSAAKQLKEVAKLIEPYQKDCFILANTHSISITGPKELIQILFNKELAEPTPWEDEWSDECNYHEKEELNDN